MSKTQNQKKEDQQEYATRNSRTQALISVM